MPWACFSRIQVKGILSSQRVLFSNRVPWREHREKGVRGVAEAGGRKRRSDVGTDVAEKGWAEGWSERGELRLRATGKGGGGGFFFIFFIFSRISTWGHARRSERGERVRIAVGRGGEWKPVLHCSIASKWWLATRVSLLRCTNTSSRSKPPAQSDPPPLPLTRVFVATRNWVIRQARSSSEKGREALLPPAAMSTAQFRVSKWYWTDGRMNGTDQTRPANPSASRSVSQPASERTRQQS